MKTTSIKLKQIKAVYRTFRIKEDSPGYITTGERFTSPEQIYRTFRYLTQETKEYFLTLHLDGKNRLVCMDTVSVGSLNQSIVHPRELFKTACLSSSSALLLVHNHPTGDPTPSSEDISITRRLKECGELMGIRVLDHIIVGDDSYTSFVERGIL